MTGRGVSLPLRAIMILLSLILWSSAVVAQDATPVAIGQNAPGEVTAETSTVRFSFTASGGETAVIQVLGFESGFAPRFRVLNPSDVEILAVANPNGLATVTGNANFADAGNYTIEVEGENGTTGQFLLSLTAGTPLPAPIQLTLGQAVEGSIQSETPVLVYEFSASPTDSLLLSVISKVPDGGPAITVRNQTADKTLATSDGELTAIAYQIRSGNGVYRVEVRQGDGTTSVPFTICVEASSAAGGCGTGLLPGVNVTPEVLPTVTLTSSAASTAACTVTSATGGGVNVRSGPDTAFGIIGSVLPGQSYPVVGQVTGGSWYQVLANGQLGWVAASVVQLQGSCGALPVVAAPAAPPAAPTTAPAAPPAATTAAPPPPPMPTTAVPPVPSGPTATDLPPLTPGSNILEGPGIGGGQADLQVVAISRSAPSEQVTMSVFATVSNSGDGYAGPFLVAICSEGECGTVTVNGLAAGATTQVSRAFVNNPEALTFSATADSGNSVAESNESNNSLYFS